MYEDLLRLIAMLNIMRAAESNLQTLTMHIYHCQPHLNDRYDVSKSLKYLIKKLSTAASHGTASMWDTHQVQPRQDTATNDINIS
jgi:hypothetical protein